MAEGNGGSGGDAAAAKDNTRQYGVFTEHVIAPDADAAEAVEALRTVVGKDSEGNQIPVTLLVRVGRAIEKGPKEALSAVGKARDLRGDYEVVADSARNRYEKVTSKTERVVQIG